MEYDLSNVKKVANYIQNIESAEKNKSEKPIAYLMDGHIRPGKMEIVEIINDFNHKEFCFINGEEYKKYHPFINNLVENYGVSWSEKAEQFSNQVTNEVIKQISDKKCNMVIEGIFSKDKGPTLLIEELKDKGYWVEAIISAVNNQVSWFSKINHCELMKSQNLLPTRESIEHHVSSLKNLEKNIKELPNNQILDRLRMYNLQKEKVYDSVHNNYLPEQKFHKMVYAESLTIQDRYMVRNFKASIEHYRIIENLQQSGFKADARMINNMKKINHEFGGFHTVAMIKKLYKKRSEMTNQKRSLVEKVATDFIKRERARDIGIVR